VLLSPAQAFDCRVELLLSRRDDALPIERNERFLAFDSRVEGGTDAPDACTVFRVGAWSDEEAVHGPVMVGAQCEPVVWLVVTSHIERNQVRGFHQRKSVVQSHPKAASGAGIIVNFENALAERAASCLLEFFVRLVPDRRIGDGEQRVNLLPLAGEVPDDESFAELVSGRGALHQIPERGVEVAGG